MSFELKGIEGLNQEDRLDYVYSFTQALLEIEKDPIALMANISAVIMGAVEDLNWAGFYLLQDQELVLGPFQGLPACTRLSRDAGVCAKAWREERAIRMEDVGSFEGHIACDSASKSELVIPLKKNSKVYGVLDLDSPKIGRFGQMEEEAFQKLVTLVEAFLHQE